MRKIFLLTIAAVMFCLGASAQSRKIVGRVTDSVGAPLLGVTVSVVGTTNATITDAGGEFTISAVEGASLEVSYVGMATQTVATGSRTRIDVVLESEASLIDDIVVVGYGSARKVGSTVGTVAQIKSETIAARPSNNVMDALQGQVAGLTIASTSGELDAPSTIRLHGFGSINAGNEPLILLDGAPVTTATLMSFNQNDIASISVLKDASATSIYGSRAANGVIYVTSKRGFRNEAPTITLRTQYTFSNPLKPTTRGMNTDEKLNYMAEHAAYLGGGTVAEHRADIVSTYGIDESVDVDWYREIYNFNAPLYQVDLSVVGGSDKTSYYFSSNYSDQDGLLPESKMTRYTFRTNIETQIKKWIKSGMSLGIGYMKSNNTLNAGNFGLWFTNSSVGMFTIPSYQSPYDENGDPLQLLPLAGNFASPLMSSRLFPFSNNRIQLNGSTFVELTPLKGLTLRSVLSANASDTRNREVGSPEYYYASGVGRVNERFERSYTWTWTNTAEYRFGLGDGHNFTLLAGQECIYGNLEAFGFGMRGITDIRFAFVNHGTELRNTEYILSEVSFNSLFGRAEYNFNERYFLDLSVRNDASSRFGKKSRNATFWSAGAMWNLKKEAFLEHFDPLSSLQLKVSYGTSGNSGIGNYAQYATLAAGSYNGANGWILNSPGNERLAWETQRLLTVSLNASIFDERIMASAEFYDRQTDNMLMEVPVPTTTGFATVMSNVGGMNNRGVDLTLGAVLFRNKNFSVGVNATMNYNRNQMTKLWDDVTEYPADADGMTYMIVGQPYASYHMEQYVGVDPATGEGYWRLADGSITTDYSSVTQTNTNLSWLAPYSGGFGLSASYKGLSLAVDFAWSKGNTIFNNTLYFAENPSWVSLFDTNGTIGALDYWKKEGDQSRYPSLDYFYNEMGGDNSYYSTMLLQDGSYLRLKNIMLSYTLPERLLSKTGFIQGVKAFVGGRNLLTWTRFEGLDPEAVGGEQVAMDDYPNSRGVTFGLELQF